MEVTIAVSVSDFADTTTIRKHRLRLNAEDIEATLLRVFCEQDEGGWGYGERALCGERRPG